MAVGPAREVDDWTAVECACDGGVAIARPPSVVNKGGIGASKLT